ncbi:MAG: DNA polymerase III subunit delta [Nitrospinota bacterium]
MARAGRGTPSGRPLGDPGGFGEALRELRAGGAEALYLLLGPEVLLAEEFLAALEGLLLSGAPPEFNRESFDGESSDLPTVLASARQLPFLALRRLVVVRRAEALGDEGVEALEAYAERPPATSCLVFLAGRADGRRRLFRVLQSRARTVALEPPRGQELIAWLVRRAEGLGCHLEEGAAPLLLELVGPPLGRLAAELEKLALYGGPEGSIGPSAVEALVGESRPEELFALRGHLAGGDWEGALRSLRKLLEGGVRPEVVVGYLRGALRRWLVARALLRKRMGERARMEALGLRSPRAAREVEAQARVLPGALLRSMMGELRKVDLQLKLGASSDPARLLEGFLFLFRRAREGEGQRL